MGKINFVEMYEEKKAARDELWAIRECLAPKLHFITRSISAEDGAKAKCVWRGYTSDFHLIVMIDNEVEVLDGRVVFGKTAPHQQVPMPRLSPLMEAVVDALRAIGCKYLGTIKIGQQTIWELSLTEKDGDWSTAIAFHWQ